MKTTIDLPDDLAREARALAQKSGATLRELVIDGLRGEVERRTRSRGRPDFVFHTVDGDGLQPGVEPAALARLGYDLPA